MTEDAKFEDGAERPLRLMAVDTNDLNVMSALIQDAVFPASEMTWDRKTGRFAILLNRFRWEDATLAERRSRNFERVQAVIVIEGAQKVATQGIARDDETVMSLLSVTWDAGADAEGAVLLTLAGDGAIKIECEALEVVLKDVTRPYVAPSRKAPTHSLD